MAHMVGLGGHSGSFMFSCEISKLEAIGASGRCWCMILARFPEGGFSCRDFAARAKKRHAFESWVMSL